jgi:hypothetical protein
MGNTEFLTVSELAKTWGVNKATIHRRIASGDIQAINVAPRGSTVVRWRIPASEADRPGMVAVVEAAPIGRKRKPLAKLKTGKRK